MIECRVLSPFLYLLRVALWHNVLSILEKDPCAAERKMYSLVDGYNILYMMSLFNFYMEDPFNGERGVLKSPSIIVLWSIWFLELRWICLTHMDAPMFVPYS